MLLDTQEMRRWISLPEQPVCGGIPGLVIREAEEDDADAMQRYYEEIAREALNNTSLRRDLIPRDAADCRALIRSYWEHQNSCLMIAVETDSFGVRKRVVGQIRLTGGEMPLNRHVVEVSINVHPDCRGQGLGTLLMKRALAWAWEQGHIYRVQLEVLTRNIGALHMYERLGFKIEGERVGAYHLYDEAEPIYSNSYIMALLLPRRGPHLN